ncbi:disulfide bond formation protein B [Pseudomonas fluorescens]|uniref:Disulfide bond formation protein B n=1 Tax=Pseudomonas fluorescens TaxID=294 RepID=A0A5E7ABY9_PSEFL|nr:disulfide bond formation protein B [Pseudomonas fluorescens]VVN73767.1 Disulfide bond formation protein B [Pseudomonas fluorescens]
MFLARSRSLFLMAFTAGALALGASLYLEYAVGLEPCSLCTVQRFFLVLLTAICLIAAVHGPSRTGCYLYWLLSLLSSLGGMLTAWRHVLLQNSPQERWQGCSPGLEYLLGNMSWSGALKRVFQGTAECTRISWTLFDMSIPEWSLLFFVGMICLGIFQLLQFLRFTRCRAVRG